MNKAKLGQIKQQSGCVVCGYVASTRSLQFHHIDRATKKFGISGSIGKSEEEMNQELAKCVVLCANCHGEVHDGLIDLNDVINRTIQPKIIVNENDDEERASIRSMPYATKQQMRSKMIKASLFFGLSYSDISLILGISTAYLYRIYKK